MSATLTYCIVTITSYVRHPTEFTFRLTGHSFSGLYCSYCSCTCYHPHITLSILDPSRILANQAQADNTKGPRIIWSNNTPNHGDTSLKMAAAHSSLLQTAIQNLQISQQAKERDRDTASSVDFASPRSDLLDLDSEDEDEIVNVGQGTRPPTRPASPKPKKMGLRQASSRLSDSEDTIDPVSFCSINGNVMAD